jgi:hypothetical protein
MVAKLLVATFGIFLLVVGSHAQTLEAAKIKSRGVRYVEPEKLKAFPTPILEYRNFDPRRHEKLAKEVVERIVYPALC